MSHSPDMSTAVGLGGKSAVLASLDRASRVEELTQAILKVLRCPHYLVPDLVQRLASPDITIAQKAVIALGYLRSPEAILPLVKVLRERHAHLYWQATAALARIGGPEVVNYLIEFLQSETIPLQLATARALGKCGIAAIVPLLACLQDHRTDTQVRFQVIHALGEIGSPLAVAVLIQQLQHPSPHIRRETIWALGQIRSPLASEALAGCLLDADLSVQSSAIQALKQIGSPALPPLQAMLKAPHSHTRSVAVRTLGQMGVETVVEDLAEVLFHDSFPYVRCDAAHALGEIGSPSAVHYLGIAVKDRDRSVRTAVIRALRKLKSPPAMEILRQIDPQWVHQATTMLQKRAQFMIREEDYTIIQHQADPN